MRATRRSFRRGPVGSAGWPLCLLRGGGGEGVLRTGPGGAAATLVHGSPAHADGRYLTTSASSSSSSSPPSSSTPSSTPTIPRDAPQCAQGEDGKVSMFYDGKCPLCVREVRHYEKLNDKAGKDVRFLDINQAEVQQVLARKGVTFSDAMARMHVETKDGRMVEGIDGFVQVWSELPYWRHLVPITRVPGMTWLMHRAYTVFARNRLWLTGREKE